MGILVSGFPVKEPFDRRGSLRGARELKPRPERSVGPSGACRHAARRGGGDRFQRDKRDPSVIVCSEIKRCQLPQSSQFFQKVKMQRAAGEVCQKGTTVLGGFGLRYPYGNFCVRKEKERTNFDSRSGTGTAPKGMTRGSSRTSSSTFPLHNRADRQR